MTRSPVFGKPEWFRPKRRGWGLTPVTWQGWVYTASWSAAIVTPYLYLIMNYQLPEALAWIAVSLGALLWDVVQVLRLHQNPQRVGEELLAEEFCGRRHVATRHFDLHLRQ